MRRALVESVGPAVALCALGLAACGARSDLLYADELGAVGGPSFSGGMPGAGGTSGSATGGGGPGGTSAVTGGGGVPMPQASGCDATGVHRGNVVAVRPDDLKELEGCLTQRGDLELIAVSDLLALRSLKAVTGSLRLSNYSSAPAGLEQLESVKELQLDTVRDFSLTALGNLGSLDHLNINRGRFTDLSGLGNVRNLRHLTITRSEIESLQGLGLTNRLAQITIRDSTLRNLSALAPLQEIDDLQIDNVSGLGILTGLQNVERAQSISLTSNDDLSNIDALNGLSELRSLTIASNPRLERADNFRRLESLGGLQIRDNERLLEVPHFQGLASATSIGIVANASLVEVSLPTLEQLAPLNGNGNFGLGTLEISDNPNLQRVALPRLASANSISILRNGELAALELAALVSASEGLSVLLNQRLPPPSLAGLTNVATEHLKLAGNQGEPTVVTPCPWLADGVCDEPTGICPVGTDPEDCGTF
jgi:hypothetical protein